MLICTWRNEFLFTKVYISRFLTFCWPSLFVTISKTGLTPVGLGIRLTPSHLQWLSVRNQWIGHFRVLAGYNNTCVIISGMEKAYSSLHSPLMLPSCRSCIIITCHGSESWCEIHYLWRKATCNFWRQRNT